MADITKVQSKDGVLDVVNLADEIWREHYTSLIGLPQVDYMLAKYQSLQPVMAQIEQGYEYYIVTKEDAQCGYMAIVRGQAADTLMISKIYVRKSCRGGGLGKLMMDYVENICRKRNIRMIYLTVNRFNTSSIEWYVHMGFVNTESLVVDIGGGFCMDDYRMEKIIE